MVTMEREISGIKVKVETRRLKFGRSQFITTAYTQPVPIACMGLRKNLNTALTGGFNAATMLIARHNLGEI